MNPEDSYVVVVTMHDHGIGKRLEQHEQELPTHEDKSSGGVPDLNKCNMAWHNDMMIKDAMQRKSKLA